MTGKGLVIGRHPVSQIRQATITRSMDPIGLTMGPVFLGVAAAAWALIPWQGWNYAAAIAAFGLGIICLSGIRKALLEIITEHGTARYNLLDPPEDCEGFVLSLRSMMGPGR